MRSDRRVALYSAGSTNRGGTGVYIQRLLEGLRASGIPWVEPLGTGCGGTFSRMFKEYVSIPMAARNFQVLHLPSFAGAAPTGVKRIVTVHDLAFLANPRWFPLTRRLYYRAVFPGIARGAHMVIADSDFTAAEAERLLGIPRSRIRRVYLSHGGVRRGGLPDFGREWGITGEYAVCVCTIEPRKNMGALLDAWRILLREKPGATLVLAGRWGWEKPSLKESLDSCPGVVRTGALPRTMLDAAIAGSRFLVYPSLYEGFGLPPMEAAALGVPSVLGPAAALREVYGEVAMFSGSTPDSLADAMIRQFQTRPDAEALIGFASAFSSVAMARNTAGVYLESLE